MPVEDCFNHRSTFIDGRIPRVDDRRLPCLGGGFLGRKVLSTGEEGLGIDDEGELPRLILMGQTGVVNGGAVALGVGVR